MDGLDDDDQKADEGEEEDTPVFQKFDRQLHGRKGEAPAKVVTIAFLKKFVAFVKERYVPSLSVEVPSFLSSFACSHAS